MPKLVTASLFSIAFVGLAYVLDTSFPVLPGLTLAAVYYDGNVMDVNGDLIDPAVRMMIGGSLLFWFALALVLSGLDVPRHRRDCCIGRGDD